MHKKLLAGIMVIFVFTLSLTAMAQANEIIQGAQNTLAPGVCALGGFVTGTPGRMILFAVVLVAAAGFLMVATRGAKAFAGAAITGAVVLALLPFYQGMITGMPYNGNAQNPGLVQICATQGVTLR